MSNGIREARLAKNISQLTIRDATGFSESVVQRIERGGGKTTQEEIDAVLKAIEEAEPGTRKMGGRPFKNDAGTDLL